MIFALATDDRTLYIFPNSEEAIAHAEGVDVEAGNWLFFDTYGAAMNPVFDIPNKWGKCSVLSGKYTLAQSGEKENNLLSMLHSVSSVEGQSPMKSVEEVKSLLTLNSTETPIGAGQ